MIKLFLSLKMDGTGEELAGQVQQLLKALGIETVVVRGVGRNRPPEDVRIKILACDGLLAIIRKERSDWVLNEIGIAYAANKEHIYGLVEKGVDVGGLLPIIRQYGTFRIEEPQELKKRIAEIATLILKGGKFGIVEPTELLGSTVRAGTPFSTGPRRKPDSSLPTVTDLEYEFCSRSHITVAIRPPELAVGQFLITILIPPEFNLRAAVADPRDKIVTDLPQELCRVEAGVRGEVPYRQYSFVKATLTFPDVKTSLTDGWMRMRIPDVVSPTVSGRYRFYGLGKVSLDSLSEGTSLYEFEPVIVKGEISPVKLSGVIFSSSGEPLEYPALIRAVGVAVDPYDPNHRSTGRPVETCCNVSPTDKGRYVLDLAPGKYDLCASILDGKEHVVSRDLVILKSGTLDITLEEEST